MNREIKFRGKRTKDGEWVYGFYVREEGLKGDGFHSISHTIITKREPFRSYQDRVYADTVGQYTGIKIGGQKLFEHDVIRYRETSLDDWRYGVVVWCGDWDYPAFDVEPSIDCGYNSLSYIVAVYQAEIIGNKWDNPELVEVLGDD